MDMYAVLHEVFHWDHTAWLPSTANCSSQTGAVTPTLVPGVRIKAHSFEATQQKLEAEAGYDCYLQLMLQMNSFSGKAS